MEKTKTSRDPLNTDLNKGNSLAKNFKATPFEKIFRNRKFWLLLVIISIIISTTWLGAWAFLALHMSLITWTAGIYFWIEKLGIKLNYLNQLGYDPTVFILWILFLIFLIKIKKINKKYLSIISIIIILLLIISLSGCSQIDYQDQY